MIDYIAAGYSADQFWRSTFREVEVHLRAARTRDERDHNARMRQAWMTALMIREQSKEFRPLHSVLIGDEADQVRRLAQKDSEDEAAWRTFALANGITPEQWDDAVRAAQAGARH